jgi:hypothetical protein
MVLKVLSCVRSLSLNDSTSCTKLDSRLDLFICSFGGLGVFGDPCKSSERHHFLAELIFFLTGPIRF